MSDDPPYTPEQMNKKIERIIKALTVDGAVNVAVSIDAMAFVAAVIYDMDPSVTVPSRLRLAAEEFGGKTLAYLKYLRRHFEATGQHFGEAIGGTMEVNPELMEQLTKGVTKQ
jgi:hypothetical protein